MDQLKEKLGPVAKHWFWIATGLVTLLSVGIWWVSSGKLLEEFEAARSQLDSDAQKITSVRSSLPTHPNDFSHREMEKLIESRTDSVMTAWTSVYERQQDILRWPVEELKEDFVREFRDLIPIELEVEFPTAETDEVETSLRNRYRDYIGGVLPNIAEIAKTKWTADFDKPAAGGMGMYGGGYGSGSGGGYDTGLSGDSGMYGTGGYDPAGGMYGGSGAGVRRDEGPLVTWETSSQEKLLTDLFPWRGGQPTTLDVLYSQENLWILRQLMQIVAEVNGDAAQRFQAKIRGINSIAIGRSVPKTAGRISRPGTPGSRGMDSMGMGMGMGGESGDPMMDMYGPGSDPYGGMGGESSMGGMGGTEVVATDPGDNRYVDTQGVPLTASQLRTALSSNSPTDAFMAVAKRVPVMMSFKMDQRSVPELLAACGSAPLMVEVRQVRILTAAAAAASASSMTGAMGGGYDSMASYGGDSTMSGGLDSGYGGSGYGTSGAGNAAGEQFPFDLTVEVYGIIYIYNPPQADALGIEQVTEDTVVDGTINEPRRGELEPEAVVPDDVATAPAGTPETAPATEPGSEPAATPEPAPATGPAPATAPAPAATPQPAAAPEGSGAAEPAPAPAVDAEAGNASATSRPTQPPS